MPDMIRRPRIEHSMLPVSKALIGNLTLSGVIGPNILSAVECSFASSALPDIKSSGLFPARCPVLRPLLTSQGISSSGSPQVRTRCVSARPPHLPPRLNPRLRCVVPTRRIAGGLAMRFLSIGPPISSSLPPPDRLPFQSWLRVVVIHVFTCGPPTGDLHPIYNAPMLGAHQRMEPTA